MDNNYVLDVRVRKDKTYPEPFLIDIRLEFYNSEFNRRLENVTDQFGGVALMIKKKGIIHNLVGGKPFKVKLINRQYLEVKKLYSNLEVHERLNQEHGQLFNLCFNSKQTISKPISFINEKDAIYVCQSIREILLGFLEKEEETYMKL